MTVEMTQDEIDIRLKCKSSRSSIIRQWRDWKTGQIIETIEVKGNETEIWWDKAFEAVVLFHNYERQIVFCDPLDEVIKLKMRGEGHRYVDADVINLDYFNRMKEAYGGENVHGPLDGTITRLTLLDLLAQNEIERKRATSLMS